MDEKEERAIVRTVHIGNSIIALKRIKSSLELYGDNIVSCNYIAHAIESLEISLREIKLEYMREF